LSSKYLGSANSRIALLSVRQVAELLGVSTAMVYRLCERGELAHIRICNAVRVSPLDVAVYLQHRRRHR
jgi:excisionase family DNA binding protein